MLSGDTVPHVSPGQITKDRHQDIEIVEASDCLSDGLHHTLAMSSQGRVLYELTVREILAEWKHLSNCRMDRY